MSEGRDDPKPVDPKKPAPGSGQRTLPGDPSRRGLGRHEQPSSSHLFAPGDSVGRYRLLAPLATGGMAQVWAAKPEGPGFARTVALKLIRPEYAADEEYARMFVDEATVAASVRHPNVCETYELGCVDGVLFMAIEWVAGDSLAGLLHQDEGLHPIPYRVGARIVADACAGLHAAHEALGADGTALNVVHRDVSPPNILLSLHGQVKVSDFGIAKAAHQLHARTRTGEVKGKFAYIAPEQIGGIRVDRRADVFALGCVLYVTTVGLRPFGSGPRAMAKILSGDYKHPAELVEGYPPELEAIVERCLMKLPRERYQTADDMRTELEQWLAESGTPVGTRDLVKLVRARIAPSKFHVAEMLMRTNHFLPDAMAYQLLRGEVEQTPTATSAMLSGNLKAAEPVPGQAPLRPSTRAKRNAERSAERGNVVAGGSPAGDPVPSTQPPQTPRDSDGPTALDSHPPRMTDPSISNRSAVGSGAVGSGAVGSEAVGSEGTGVTGGEGDEAARPGDSAVPTYRPPRLGPLPNIADPVDGDAAAAAEPRGLARDTSSHGSRGLPSAGGVNRILVGVVIALVLLVVWLLLGGRT